MIKYVAPSGWDWDRPVAIPVPYGSRGLTGNDRGSFVKTASEAMLAAIDGVKIAKDEVPMHLIMLGASERHGFNRNGDGFTADTCRKYHPTFTKFAKWFRNHKNRPEKGDPHYGIVKASVFNEPMQRIEIMVALNAAKSACDRNGGLIADLEMQKLAAGKDIPTSMACKVPFDVCSWCGNKAPKRADYCTEKTCEAGGCAKNLTRLVKVGGDVHHLGVFNPTPLWFDASGVFRPADRIAYGAGADYLQKTAEDLDPLAFLATDLDREPWAVLEHDDPAMAARVKLAAGLAKLETEEPQGLHGFLSDVRHFPADRFDVGTSEKLASALGALADRKVVLSLPEFALLTGRRDQVKAAAAALPGIYQRMQQDAALEDRVLHRSCHLADADSSRTSVAAKVAADTCALTLPVLSRNAMLVGVRGLQATAMTKQAGVCDSRLSEEYAAYQLTALERIAKFDDELTLTARMAIRQNCLC